MATEKEQVIFEYKVEIGGALADAERFKKNIVQTKEEQKQLNDAYKKGSISLEEYVSDSVRLEAILKKEQTAYNNLSKAMTGTKTQTDKLIESNDKLAKSNTKLGDQFQNVAGNINIAGTNLGSLTGGMTAFLNPATAAATIVGTLATAYFNTGRGAQDLEAIQFKLQATTEVLSNKIADFVDTLKDSDSPLGSFVDSLWESSTAAKALTLVWRSTIGDQVDALAGIKDQLDDLNESRAVAQAAANNLLDDNSALLEEINRAQTTYQDKLDKNALMQDNINNAFEKTISIKQEEVRLLNEVLNVNKNDEATRRRINAINLEISQEERKREKMLNVVKTQLDNIVTAEAARAQKAAEAAESERQILEHKQAQVDLSVDLNADLAILQSQAESYNEIASALDNVTLKTDNLSKSIVDKHKKTEADIKATKAGIASDKDRTGSLLVLSNSIGGAAAIFEKHTVASRALSAVQAAINSYLAGTEVLKSTPGGSIQRILAMVATITAGLAQQGKILGAFAGGGSFMTKGPTWLLVGDNPGGKERVDVTPVSGKGQTRIFNDGLAMAGGGSVNGSILAASSTAPIDAQFGLENALSELPPIQFVETDYKRFRQTLEFKEQISER